MQKRANPKGDNIRVPVYKKKMPRKDGKLIGISGSYKGMVIPLAFHESVILGRDPAVSNLVFKDPKISKKHCKITRQSWGYRVESYSDNGTFLKNGARITKDGARLNTGDEIALGENKQENSGLVKQTDNRASALRRGSFCPEEGENTMTDFNHLCPGCMREKKLSEAICPHCGFSQKSYQQNPGCLPLWTILAGKYMIGRVLGQGGFGITYLGLDLNLNVRIAIKEYFPAELANRDTSSTHGNQVLVFDGKYGSVYRRGLEKYVEEAQHLSHFFGQPGIVSIKDFFHENNTAYMVMEYIDGKTLQDYLKEKGGKLSEAEALLIMKPVLEALKKVHASGIIHRDISPDNLMLTFDAGGTVTSVKLIDFGASRIPVQNDPKSMTIILKHGYAPEEQYRTHARQGSWTDVYAVCAVFYRILTGKTPVSAMDRMAKVPLKPLSSYPGISKSTANALMKGLAVQKESRTQTVQQLIEALYPKQTRKRKQPKAVFPMVALVLLAAGMFLIPKDRLSEWKTVVSKDSFSVLSSPQTDSAGSDRHLVLRRPDGTAEAFGRNTYGQCNLSEWTNLSAVAAGNTFSAGLRTDGTVVVAGLLQGKKEVERWKHIVEISGSEDSLYGLTADGRLVVNSKTSLNEDCLQWRSVKTIAAGPYVISALTGDGTVLSTGLGRTPANITGWNDVRFLVSNQELLLGVKQDGSVTSALLWADTAAPALEGLESFQNIVQLTLDYTSCYGVAEDGTLYHAGSNYYGSADCVEELIKDKTLTGLTATKLETRFVGSFSDGSFRSLAPTYCSTAPEAMEKLQSVQHISMDNASLLLGLSEDGTAQYQSSDFFVQELLEKNPKLQTLGALRVFENETNSHQGFYYLDSDGILWTTQRQEKELLTQKLSEVPLSKVFAVSGETVEQQRYLLGLSKEQRLILYEQPFSKLSETLKKAQSWTGVQQAVCFLDRDQMQSTILALTADGTVQGIRSDGKKIKELKQWKNIKSICAGRYAAGAITKDGKAVFLKDDPEYDFGQYQTEDWTNLSGLALGAFHTVGLRSDGTVCAVGRNDAGQCEVQDWSDIVFLTAGESCTLGIRSDGTLVTAGDIGW